MKKHKAHAELFIIGPGGETPVAGTRKLKMDRASVVCPRCEGHDIEAGTPEAEGDMTWYDVVCNTCWFEWREFFAFSYGEATEGQEANTKPYTVAFANPEDASICVDNTMATSPEDAIDRVCEARGRERDEIKDFAVFAGEHIPCNAFPEEVEEAEHSPNCTDDACEGCEEGSDGWCGCGSELDSDGFCVAQGKHCPCDPDNEKEE